MASCEQSPCPIDHPGLDPSGGSGTELEPAARRWIQQYGAARPLKVRLAPKKALHDRSIFVDGTVVWTLTQSFNAFANR